MNIVHIVRQFYPGIGGLEDFVMQLSLAQIAESHTIRVVTLDTIFGSQNSDRLPPLETIFGIEVVRIPWLGSKRYPIALSAIKHTRNADVVHIHGVDFFFDYFAWTRVLHRRVLILTTHGGVFHTAFASTIKRIYFSTFARLSILNYAAVVAISTSDRLMFSKIRKRSLKFIENGVNVVKYRDAGARIPIKTIISVGRFSSNKRIDRLIEFISALRRIDSEWKLILSGCSYDVNGEELRTLAVSAGIGDAVTIIESPSEEQIRDLMHACSVFVSASEYEGFGLAAIEAISAGLFPVLSDIPPFQSVIDRAGVGLLLNFEDHESAAAKFNDEWKSITEYYAKNRELLINFSASYDWTQVAQKYQSVYEQACEKKIRTILNIPILAMTYDEAKQKLDEAFALGEPKIIAFANVHTLNKSVSDIDFRIVLQNAITLNDGIGVDLASSLLFKRAFPDNLNGTDFIPKYFRDTSNYYNIYFLGGKSEIVGKAAAAIRKIAPQHRIAGYQGGYFHPSMNHKIVDDIRMSKANVLLVGMGNPAQELWLNNNLVATGCRLGFGVGALFDFLSLEIPRAPLWVRMARLEWLFRLINEPRRLWPRYILGGPVFVARVTRQFVSGRRP